MTSLRLTERQLGIQAGVWAGLIWGSYPFIYKPLADIDILEVISHRVFWSVVFMLPFALLAKGGVARMKEAFTEPAKVRGIMVCAIILSGWWLTYVFCLVSNRILEAGLGYFLGPVLTTLLGRLLLRERADFVSLIAVGLSFLGIAYFAFSTQGSLPIYGLLLGLFYSGYTVFKRGFLRTDTRTSVAAELVVLLPFAVAYLVYKYHEGAMDVFSITSTSQNILLIITGVANIIPMLMYSYSSRTLDSVAMSFIQYISPACNFLLAALYYKESLSSPAKVMFVFVIIGVVVYVVNSNVKASLQTKLIGTNPANSTS